MWAFKSLWDKGLVYEGFRVLAYCWRCETPLSNTETRMDDVYRDRQDPALTVGFELVDDAGAATGEVLAPGRRRRGRCRPTSPSPSVPTSTTPSSTTTVSATDPRRRRGSAHYAAELGDGEPVVGRGDRAPSWSGAATARCSSSSPTSTRYGTEQAFQVLAADFVSTEDGTGVVHMAPGFGEDDQLACNAAGIPTLVPMDEHGRYTAEVADWAGEHVFDANPRRHPPPQGRRARCCATRPTTTPTRTAGAAPSRSSTGPSRRGSSSRHHVPRPHGRAQRADHVGARRTSSTAASASGCRTPATGRSAATASGARRSRCGAATTRTTPASTCTARSPSWRPTSASRSPTCTARRSTTSCGPTPTTRRVAR